MKKTYAEKKSEERKRMRAEGWVLKQVWTKPDQWPRIQAYIRKINKARDGAKVG